MFSVIKIQHFAPTALLNPCQQDRKRSVAHPGFHFGGVKPLDVGPHALRALPQFSIYFAKFKIQIEKALGRAQKLSKLE